MLAIRNFFITLILLASLALGAVVVLLERDWVDFGTLDLYKIAQPSVVLDDEGAVLTTFELDKRAPVSFAKLPRCLIQAIFAA